MIYIAAGGVFLAALLIGGGLSLITPVLTGITSMVAYLYLMTFISVRSTNLTYNNTVLHEGSFSFHSNWRDMSYLKMVVINSLLTLLTLGFYLPWAKVRVAHYSADHLVLNTHADLDGFIAAEEDNISETSARQSFYPDNIEQLYIRNPAGRSWGIPMYIPDA